MSPFSDKWRTNSLTATPQRINSSQRPMLPKSAKIGIAQYRTFSAVELRYTSAFAILAPSFHTRTQVRTVDSTQLYKYKIMVALFLDLIPIHDLYCLIMAIFSPLRLSQLLLPVAATPVGLQHPIHHGITWRPCGLGLNETAPMSCGSLAVPLDYTDTSSNKKLMLELLKVDAVNSPSRGSILFNFGGPGASGKADLAYFAGMLLG